MVKRGKENRGRGSIERGVMNDDAPVHERWRRRRCDSHNYHNPILRQWKNRAKHDINRGL